MTQQLHELLPVVGQNTCMPLSHNIGVAVFCGFVPVIVTGLLSLTSSPVVPSYPLLMAAVLGIVALLSVSRKLGFFIYGGFLSLAVFIRCI